MTTLLEAAKQALEALEEISSHYMSLPKKGCMALAAIEEVLAQPEQCECPACKVTPHASDCAVHNEPAYPKGACDCGAQPYPDNFIDALKYGVARRDSEAQQAYEDAFLNGTGVMIGDKRIDPASIYKEPEQEPVAWLHNGKLHEFDPSDWATGPVTPLYTSPPAKPWVNPSLKEYEDIMLANITPRTNDERDGIMCALNDMVVLLKEKNT